MNEIIFNKYNKKGAGYHWDEISNSITKRNLYTVSRYQQVIELIGNEVQNCKILDIGCGDGVLAYLLSLRGADVTGTDTSSEALDYAKNKLKKNKQINFILSSVYDIPLPDKSYDYIVTTDVIEHLAEPQKMLNEINRLWTKRGKVIISTPIKLTAIPEDTMHIREYQTDELWQLLSDIFLEVHIIKSHPVIWKELQNKNIFFKRVMNILNILINFNPYLSNNWKYYSYQLAIVTK
ncbi:MAG: Glycosyl transferase, family 2:Glycosyl transferase, group 1 [uncultured bacterium]|nr:MAG: Glycosyl transferase, family 2:Glycosyl transferase, group 1 [uncultured bacterium]